MMQVFIHRLNSKTIMVAEDWTYRKHLESGGPRPREADSIEILSFSYCNECHTLYCFLVYKPHAKQIKSTAQGLSSRLSPPGVQRRVKLALCGVVFFGSPWETLLIGVSNQEATCYKADDPIVRMGLVYREGSPVAAPLPGLSSSCSGAGQLMCPTAYSSLGEGLVVE